MILKFKCFSCDSMYDVTSKTTVVCGPLVSSHCPVCGVKTPDRNMTAFMYEQTEFITNRIQRTVCMQMMCQVMEKLVNNDGKEKQHG